MGINQELINEQGITSTYQRIETVFFNYDLNQLDIRMSCYVDESYRLEEKDQLLNIQTVIDRYYQLEAIGIENMTDEEKIEFQQIDIKDLLAKRIDKKSIIIKNMSFTIPQEIRDWVYGLVMNHPEFGNGEMV